MQKADFEKNVQQKMQELRFHPSEEVWKRVEVGIAPSKRRRPVVLWFLVAGLMLAGAGFWLFNRPSHENIAGHTPEVPGQSIAGKQTEDEKVSTGSAQPNLKELSAASETGKRESNVPRSTTDIAKNQLEKQEIKHDQLLPLKSKKKQQEKRTTSEDGPLEYAIHSENIYSINSGLRNTTPIQQGEESAIVGTIGREQLHADLLQKDLPVISPTGEISANEKKLSVKKTNWQFALNASAGISDLGEELLQSANAAGLFYDPLQSSVGGGGAVSHKPSEVNSGASFSIGVSANKSISKKLTIGIGIGYQYFSNRIKVGEKVDSTVLINQNNFAMDRVSQYYKSNGSTPYTNQYHFIILPVTLKWQFAKQFTWENGIVAAQMINTNALHYDGVTGKYYEDKNLFNDFQLSATTAVLFGLNKNRIQVGPQLQYTFTNLLQSGTGDSKHLRSVAVKANVELWKK